MADLVPFPAVRARQSRKRTGPAGPSRDNVVIFDGVRYEHCDGEPEERGSNAAIEAAKRRRDTVKVS